MKAAPAGFQPFADTELAELEAMTLALYAEDAYGEPMTPAKVRLTVKTFADRPVKGRIITFRVVEAVVGYAILIMVWSKEYGGDIALVDELYVKPPWRGQGIAAALIESVADQAHGGIRALQLEVTPRNRRVLGYYRRLGFRIDANRHFFRLASTRGGPATGPPAALAHRPVPPAPG